MISSLLMKGSTDARAVVRENAGLDAYREYIESLRDYWTHEAISNAP